MGRGALLSYPMRRLTDLCVHVDVMSMSLTSEACRLGLQRVQSPIYSAPRLHIDDADLHLTYAQVLAGGVRGSGPTFGSSGLTNVFGMSAGGGLDFRPFRRCFFAIRIVEVDYLLTRFNRSNQNNVEIKSGIVLRWGGQ
jgi:hypothetical protein